MNKTECYSHDLRLKDGCKSARSKYLKEPYEKRKKIKFKKSDYKIWHNLVMKFSRKWGISHDDSFEFPLFIGNPAASIGQVFWHKNHPSEKYANEFISELKKYIEF